MKPTFKVSCISFHSGVFIKSANQTVGYFLNFFLAFIDIFQVG